MFKCNNCNTKWDDTLSMLTCPCNDEVFGSSISKKDKRTKTAHYVEVIDLALNSVENFVTTDLSDYNDFFSEIESKYILVDERYEYNVNEFKIDFKPKYVFDFTPYEDIVTQDEELFETHFDENNRTLIRNELKRFVSENHCNKVLIKVIPNDFSDDRWHNMPFTIFFSPFVEKEDSIDTGWL